MSKLTILLILCLVVVQTFAWSFTSYKGTNSGELKQLSDDVCTDNCVNASASMNDQIHPFIFGTMEGLRCWIKMYKNVDC